MATTVIRESQELHSLAQPIIREHHSHLKGARVLYLFTSAKSSKAGRVRSGVAKKLTPEQRFLSSGLESVEEGYDFMVVINVAQWRRLTEDQQIALLDHELCYCSQKETVNRRTGAVTRKWVTRGPDLEEFAEIVERHGLWNPDVKRLVVAGAQLALDLPLEELAQDALPGMRRTTVDEQGTVLSTEVLGDDLTEETADGAAEGLDEAAGTTGTDEEAEEAEAIDNDRPVPAPPGNGHSGDWRGDTGLSELEETRKRRREFKT